MTLSEKICLELNRKFFLDDFVLSNLYYLNNGVQNEICDGLIEFEDFYVIIQVKERNIKNEENITDDNKWLNKKVYKKASQQVNNTIKIMQQEQKVSIKDMRGQTVSLDTKKRIIPVIIFQNENINEYLKIYHSQSSNIYINIFSEKDYKTMLENIIMPIDLVNYLIFRENLFQKGNADFYLIDDENTIILANTTTERNVAECYLSYVYKNGLADLDLIKQYLFLLKNFYAHKYEENGNYKEILYKLTKVDFLGAANFIKNWNTLLENAKKKIHNFYHKLIFNDKLHGKFGILFISIELNSKEDNLDYIKFLLSLFICKFNLNTGIAIVGYFIDNKKEYKINWYYTQQPFFDDSVLKEFLQDNDPW